MRGLGIVDVDRARRTVREWGRVALEQYPPAYLAAARRADPGRALVDTQTDLVIEGYPRSGNSYLLAWIATANPDLRIASHTHSAAHVRAARRARVPVIVALREPYGALASTSIREPHRSIAELIHRYDRFYRRVAEIAGDVILSPFEITTKVPSRVVEALSHRMGLDLATGPAGGHDEALEAVDRYATRINGYVDESIVGRPSVARDELNRDVRARLREDHRDDLVRLSALHERLAGHPSVVR